MIKAETKVRGGKKGVETEVCGTGEEVYIEFLVLLCDMLQGGFKVGTLKKRSISL